MRPRTTDVSRSRTGRNRKFRLIDASPNSYPVLRLDAYISPCESSSPRTETTPRAATTRWPLLVSKGGVSGDGDRGLRRRERLSPAGEQPLCPQRDLERLPARIARGPAELCLDLLVRGDPGIEDEVDLARRRLDSRQVERPSSLRDSPIGARGDPPGLDSREARALGKPDRAVGGQ